MARELKAGEGELRAGGKEKLSRTTALDALRFDRRRAGT